MPTSAALSKISRVVGVTRIARVTGLDRCGVEVACAVRPSAHVLQVSNGKGETFAQAALGALCEAAELWAAERVDASALRFGSGRQMRALGPVVAPRELPLAAPWLAGDEVRIAWRTAADLHGGPFLLVPAQAVHCPPRGAPSLGPAGVRWSSNGSGAGRDPEAALLHALLEAVERDQLARALPRGFTRAAIARRLLRPESLRAAPRTAARARSLMEAGFGVHLFDLAPGGQRDLCLPVAGCVLVDLEGGPVPLTAGYACRLGRDDALLAALLEAAQSRLTDVHGAREDVAAPDPEAAAGLRAACEECKPTRDASELPDLSGGVPLVLQRLRRAGHARAAAVDLAEASLGLRVVKVLVPGLLVSELL